MLHDLDFEMYPEEHCIKTQEIMRSRGLDERLVHAVVSHGFGLTAVDTEPGHPMEKVLFAVDELTGLIGAVAVSARPDRLTGQDATVGAKLRNVAGRVSRLLHGAHPR